MIPRAIQNAEIEKAVVHSEGLTLSLKGPGWGVAVTVSFDLIPEILTVTGQGSVDQMVGKIVRVEQDGWAKPIKAIGHPIQDLWVEVKP